jgi:hypothetical protein
MDHRSLIGAATFVAMALAILTLAPVASGRADDVSRYPDWRGEWVRAVGVQWDPTKPAARGQQAPLTAEYQKIYDATLAQQVVGGQEYNPQVRCLPSGMPRMMIGYEPMEVIVTPETTYIRLVYMAEFRRIYTDGRDWPAHIEPTYAGYSIGRWVDPDGSGRFNALEVETRGFKGPRVVENTGIPIHADSQTVIKERISLDQAAGTLNDEVTLIDHAFTRPWTVTRKFKREPKEAWTEYFCGENNNLINIGQHSYYINYDGNLMPMEKDEPPPGLRGFDQPKK